MSQESKKNLAQSLPASAETASGVMIMGVDPENGKESYYSR